MTTKESVETFEEMVTPAVADFPPDDETFNPDPRTKEMIVNPASATIKCYSPSGFDIFLTLRDWDAPKLLSRVGKAVGWLKENGYTPDGRAIHSVSHSPPSQPPAPKSGNGGTPPAQAPQQTAPQQEKPVEKGMTLLHTLKVDADGRVEFYCDGFRWPFKDGRGAETVAALFDKHLGWTAEHFTPGAKYDNLDLTVHWEKPGKYYNVIKVTG